MSDIGMEDGFNRHTGEQKLLAKLTATFQWQPLQKTALSC